MVVDKSCRLCGQCYKSQFDMGRSSFDNIGPSSVVSYLVCERYDHFKGCVKILCTFVFVSRGVCCF